MTGLGPRPNPHHWIARDRELWHHDLVQGKTTVRQVDVGGKPREVTEAWEDRLVANEIERQCTVALLACS